VGLKEERRGEPISFPLVLEEKEGEVQIEEQGVRGRKEGLFTTEGKGGKKKKGRGFKGGRRWANNPPYQEKEKEEREKLVI